MTDFTNLASFDVLKGTNIYSGEGVLVKRKWWNYMQTEEYARFQLQIYDALDESIEVARRTDLGEQNRRDVIAKNIAVARKANEGLLNQLPSYFDRSAQIRGIERQLLGAGD